MLGKLKQLQPREFENLSYDLLLLSGVRNLVWRTPGTDGGRDLEGLCSRTDFSGGVVIEKWYFECKRYAAALNWPTVFEKISYATNQGADYLLFITTSSFSPQCADEVTNWNARRTGLSIRQWPGHQLVGLLEVHPKLQLKYALAATINSPPAAVFPLSLEIAKSIQAAYSSEAFQQSASPPIEFASTLSDLMTACIADVESIGRLQFRPFRDLQTDGFGWMSLVGNPPTSFDRLTLRSLVAALHLLYPTDRFVLTVNDNAITISRSQSKEIAIPPSLTSIVNEICFWGNMEIKIKEGAIMLARRA